LLLLLILINTIAIQIKTSITQFDRPQESKRCR
jgi:hypothetical protein